MNDQELNAVAAMRDALCTIARDVERTASDQLHILRRLAVAALKEAEVFDLEDDE